MTQRDAGVESEHEELLEFLYQLPVALAQASTDGAIVLANAAFARLLMPLAPGGVLDDLYRVFERTLPDLRQRVRARGADTGLVCDGLHVRVDAPAGQRGAPSVLSLTVLKLDASRLMVTLSDVSEAVRRERELRQSRLLIEALTAGVEDYALLPLDHAGCVREWNSSVLRLTGFRAEDVLGKSFGMFYGEEADAPLRARERMQEADRHGWSLDEGWRRRADDSRFWGHCLLSPLHPPGEQREEERAYSLVIRDVSDRREASEALRRALTCDHLTGLANRRAFMEAAELEFERARRHGGSLAMVLADLDHFKAVNDRYGHAAGDAVLKGLAGIIAAESRGADLAARLGGEEFAILLPGTDRQGALAVAQRLCATVAGQPILVEGLPIRVTLSAGVCVTDASGSGPERLDALLGCADDALYAAKGAGRNRVVAWSAEIARRASDATVAEAAP